MPDLKVEYLYLPMLYKKPQCGIGASNDLFTVLRPCYYTLPKEK